MSDRLGIATGAAGGVGMACAERFAAEGWSPILVDIDDKVRSVAQSVRGGPGQAISGVVADITEPDGVAAIAAAAKVSGAPLKFLGLVAGTQQTASAIEATDMADWDRVMNVNLRANVLMMRQFIPALREDHGASIVTISSWSGHNGHGFFSALMEEARKRVLQPRK